MSIGKLLNWLIYLRQLAKNNHPILRVFLSVLNCVTILVESPKGTSPSGSHRSVLETLASYGSSYPLQLPSLHKPLTPPIYGWLKSIFGYVSAFAPFPLQKLHHYYELIRPCVLHRYSDPCGASTWISPLTSVQQVPTFHKKA